MPLRTTWPEATVRLAHDPAFGPLVEHVGPIRMRPPRGTPFEALASTIVHQQLAGAAARTIHGRFVELFESDVTPAAVLDTSEDRLRSAGLSASKAAAIRSLAEHAATGRVKLERLAELSDAEVVDELVTVRGIGPWTAQMFLLFDLRRPDVWPTGDLGVRKGLGRVLGLSETPTPSETQLIGTGYRPWRSGVAWYCWRALENPTPEPSMPDM